MRIQIWLLGLLICTGSILSGREDQKTPPAPVITKVSPDRGTPGSSGLKIELTGSNLAPGSSVGSDDNDLTITGPTMDGQKIIATLSISQTAALGNHKLKLIPPNGGTAPKDPNINFAVVGPSVKVSPLTAKPGDTVKLIATTDNCPGDATTQGWLNKDSLTVSGSEIATTYQVSDQCSVTYSAQIAATPLNRELTINVTGVQPKSSPATGATPAGAGVTGAGSTAAGSTADPSSPKSINLGNSTFRILDAIPPGPIPPGINPQVDVSWTIMSEKACSDEFGTRLSKYYYCIDVVLGNNSGYPLILAAVAFLRHVNNTDFRDATASYVATRAMVQYGQVISARALTISTLQAAGAIIAGSVGFSGNAGRQGRIALWSTLVGSVAAGVVGSLIPDRTQAEDSSLDDEALRDGRLIPNNSPVRFAVFVDRATVMPLLLRSKDQLDADATAAAAQAATLQSQIGSETDPTKRDNLQKEHDMWDGWSKEMRVEAGFYQSAPDNKVYTKKEGLPKAINPLSRQKAALSSNLLFVRWALGNLIIVGDQIEYRQRIKIDTSAVVPGIQPTPVVTDSNPKSVVQGKAGDVILLGQNLAKVVKVTARNCNPTINLQLDASGTSLTLKGFLVTGCTDPAISLVIDNGSGVPFVYPLSITPAPQLDDPPKSQPTAGKAVTLAITGTALKDSPTATVTLKLSGKADLPVDASNIKITPDQNVPDKALTVALDLSDNKYALYAVKGANAVVTIGTTAGGQSKPVTFTFK
jgi:hypothetical protein